MANSIKTPQHPPRRRWWLLMLLAVLAEAVAVDAASAALDLHFWLWHLACVILAERATQARHDQPPRWYTLAFFFFLPVLGLSSYLIYLLWHRFWKHTTPTYHFQRIELPHFSMPRHQRAPAIRHGQIGRILQQNHLPLQLRLRSLLTLQSVPTRQSARLLRESLSDAQDDLRLLAYGMLEQREKDLSLRLQQALDQQAMGQEQDDSERAAAERTLAELYWELVYQNLSEGHMRQYALERTQHHVRQALRLAVRDAGLWALYGRWHLLQGDVRTAEAAWQVALRQGYPRLRLLPYLAETAYLQHDYVHLRKLCRQMPLSSGLSALQNSLRFWGASA